MFVKTGMLSKRTRKARIFDVMHGLGLVLKCENDGRYSLKSISRLDAFEWASVK